MSDVVSNLGIVHLSNDLASTPSTSVKKYSETAPFIPRTSSTSTPSSTRTSSERAVQREAPEFISDFQFWFNVVLFLITVIVGSWYIYEGYAFLKGNKYAGTIPPSDTGRALLIAGWVIITGMSYLATYLGTRASRDDPEQYRKVLTYSYASFVATAVWGIGFTFGWPIIIVLGNILTITVTAFRFYGLMSIAPFGALLLVPFLILNVISLMFTILNLPCGKDGDLQKLKAFCDDLTDLKRLRQAG